MRPAVIAALAVACIAAAGAAFLWSANSSKDGEQAAVPIGGPFELTREDGQRVTQADFAGRYMLLYFGYTYCPDVCPTGLATMMAAYDELSEAEKARIEPVFITVDPERDTIEAVGEYTALFHDDLIGLSGSVEDVEKTKKTFRVYAKKADDDPENYLVDHSTFTYLIGPDGSYVTHFNHGDTPDAITTALSEKIS